MRKSLMSALIVIGMTLGLGLPAMANPGHRSCKGFGEIFASFAQTGEAGAIISYNARNQVEAFGQVFTPPGSIAAIIHAEHDLFCESRK